MSNNKKDSLAKDVGDLYAEQLPMALYGKISNAVAKLGAFPIAEGLEIRLEPNGLMMIVSRSLASGALNLGGTMYDYELGNKLALANQIEVNRMILEKVWNVKTRDEFIVLCDAIKDKAEVSDDEAAEAFKSAEQFEPSELVDNEPVKPTYIVFFPEDDTGLDSVDGARNMGIFDEPKHAEATLTAFANGLMGIEKISEKSPVACAVLGCSNTMTSADDVHIIPDMHSGKTACVCNDCFSAIAEQNKSIMASDPEIASKQTGLVLGELARFDPQELSRHLLETNGFSKKQVKKMSDKEVLLNLTNVYTNNKKVLDALTAKFDELQTARNTMLDDSNTIVKMLKDELASSEEELKQVKKSGLKEDSVVMQAAIKQVDSIKKQLAEYDGIEEKLARMDEQTDRAHEALKAANSKVVEFSELPDPLYDYISKGTDTPASQSMLDPTNSLVKKASDSREPDSKKEESVMTHTAAAEGYTINPTAASGIKDPYPDASPNERCPCGKGRSYYKNCHGKNAFVTKQGVRGKNGKRLHELGLDVVSKWSDDVRTKFGITLK